MTSGAPPVVRTHPGTALDGAVTPVPASHTQTRPVLTLTMQLTSAEDIIMIPGLNNIPNTNLGSQSLF